MLRLNGRVPVLSLRIRAFCLLPQKSPYHFFKCYKNQGAVSDHVVKKMRKLNAAGKKRQVVELRNSEVRFMTKSELSMVMQNDVNKRIEISWKRFTVDLYNEVLKSLPPFPVLLDSIRQAMVQGLELDYYAEFLRLLAHVRTILDLRRVIDAVFLPHPLQSGAKKTLLLQLPPTRYTFLCSKVMSALRTWNPFSNNQRKSKFSSPGQRALLRQPMALVDIVELGFRVIDQFAATELIRVDSKLFNSIFHVCAAAGNVPEGLKAIERIKEKYGIISPVHFGVLLHACANMTESNAAVTSAHVVLTKMRNYELDLRNDKLWGSYLTLLVKHSRLQTAFQFMRSMPTRFETEPTPMMFAIVIGVAAQQQSASIPSVQVFLSEIMQCGLVLDSLLAENLMKLCWRQADLEGAMFLAGEMQKCKVPLHLEAFRFLVKLFGQINRVDLILEYLGNHISKQEPAMLQTLYTDAITALTQARHYPSVFYIIKDMQEKKMDISMEVYNLALSATVRSSTMPEDAHQLWRIIQKKEPDAYTYANVIRLYGKDRVHEIPSLLEEMMFKNIPVDDAVLSEVVKAYCKKGRVEEAIAYWVDHVTGSGCAPPLSTVFSIVRGCFAQKNPELASQVFERLGKDELAHVVPDRRLYLKMLREYSTMGCKEEFLSTNQRMKQQGISIPSSLYHTWYRRVVANYSNKHPD